MRLDLDTLRAAVTIRDVLAAAGIEPPTRGRRMRCPVHGGANPTAFALLDEDRRYHCHACVSGVNYSCRSTTTILAGCCPVGSSRFSPRFSPFSVVSGLRS
jgi:hypothetical protein